jgi:hypothetical protein
MGKMIIILKPPIQKTSKKPTSLEHILSNSFIIKHYLFLSTYYHRSTITELLSDTPICDFTSALCFMGYTQTT